MVGRALTLVGLLILVGCDSDSGSRSNPTVPSSAGDRIVLESQRLTRSATGRFCSVSGTLRNDNSFTASIIRVDWQAFNSAGGEIATATAFEFNVESGGRVAYGSSLFEPEVPCSGIAQFEPLTIRVTR